MHLHLSLSPSYPLSRTLAATMHVQYCWALPGRSALTAHHPPQAEMPGQTSGQALGQASGLLPGLAHPSALQENSRKEKVQQ
jgi:hypothetical protein